eukprot:1155635-Pelagomonas_calceolata.AAC.23
MHYRPTPVPTCLYKVFTQFVVPVWFSEPERGADPIQTVISRLQAMLGSNTFYKKCAASEGRETKPPLNLSNMLFLTSVDIVGIQA